jgi:hypothetical protein
LELLNSVSLWRFVENWEFAFCCGWVGGWAGEEEKLEGRRREN